MKILIDENCLWLAREPHRALFINDHHHIVAVGEPDTPSIRASDQQIIQWLQKNACSILTYDYDDFHKHAESKIVIFGLPGQGVYLTRSDIIVQCLKNCLSTFGANPIPAGLYVLSYYRWD